MKTYIYIISLILIFHSSLLEAQEVASDLGEARSSYTAGDLENTRFELQQALNGINQTIGNEILIQLPVTLGDMNAVEGSDNVTGSGSGFAGLFVSREYQGENTSATFQIISDSPMLVGVNSLLSMSVFLAADPNQKRIKIDGYKALMTRSEDEEGLVKYDVNMPFGDSMMNFTTEGVNEEKQVTGILDEVPVGEIVKTTQ